MNGIIQRYHDFKSCKTFGDLVEALRSYGMPLARECPENFSLGEKCDSLGRDWVRFLFARAMRPRATVSDAEFDGEAQMAAAIFYSVLSAGDMKTLFLVTKEASEFIEATAFTQETDLDFFKANFARPVVLYAGEPNVLFPGVRAVSVVYDEKCENLECIISRPDTTLSSREFYRCCPVQKFMGDFTRSCVAVEEFGEGAKSILRQGIVASLDELDDMFYKALIYVFKFVLLRQCEKQPIVVERQYREKGNGVKERRVHGLLSHQKVSLSATYRRVMQAYRPDEKVCLDKEGKQLRTTQVIGFVRRQHYGPGRSLVKLIWIEAHESHAWMRDGIRIVTVVR